jgi:hypothetical protein
MTIQDAIETYNIINPELETTKIIMILLGVIMMVFGSLGSGNIDNIKKASKIEIGSLIATFIGMIFVTIVAYQEYSVKPKEIAKWEVTVREEYVNKLPIEKIEVLDYKGIGQKVNENQLKIEFVYLNQNVLTMDTVVTTIKTVKGLKQPYLEYQYIEKNLPQTSNQVIFKEGYHDPVLYIPE